jgi:type I restriction enzyme R subunit
MPKLDWTQRESVRATLRRNVRRLLAKYGYPPDLAEGATQLVLRQAELSTENGVSDGLAGSRREGEQQHAADGASRRS